MSIKVHSKEYDKEEPFLKEPVNSSKYVLFPIKHKDIFEIYKKASSVFWLADEIILNQDLRDLEKLNDNERDFINHVLAFFAASDGIVMENLVLRFYNEIPIPEAKNFYAFQIAIEAVHSETYSLFIDTYCKESEEKNRLFQAVSTYPAIKEKAEWAIKWINDDNVSLAQRLIGYAIVEGVFFSASFCAIFWMRERGLLPGLSFANQLISRDESLHTEFSCLMYSKLVNRVPEEIVNDMFDEAVEIEDRFINESIRCEMIGMNSKLMSDYIKYIADRVLVMLGYSQRYEKENPFQFMEFSSVDGKTNFFDTKVAEYSRGHVSFNKTDTNTLDNIEISDDF